MRQIITPIIELNYLNGVGGLLNGKIVIENSNLGIIVNKEFQIIFLVFVILNRSK